MTSASIHIYPLHENEEGEEVTVDTAIQKDEYVEKSLGLIPINSPFRKWLLEICNPKSKFDLFILIMIFLNTIVMACVDYRFVDENYEPVSDQSLRNYLVEKAEVIFMAVFIIESLMKIMAFGFFTGNKAYLRSAWNTFDFVIVLSR